MGDLGALCLTLDSNAHAWQQYVQEDFSIVFKTGLTAEAAVEAIGLSTVPAFHMKNEFVQIACSCHSLPITWHARVIRQDSATVDAYWPPEWQVEHNIFHFPVVCQPIVAAYNLGPDAPPNNQTLVWPPHYT
jgi:hypothetical protein